MSGTLNAAVLFLVNTLFDLYLFILVIRLVLSFVGANYFDPITQFIIKATNFIIQPLKRFIPNFRRIELSTVLVIFILELLKFLIICAMSFGIPSIMGLILLAVGDGLKLILMTFFYAILLQAILSWIQPHSPINHTLAQFNSPVMRPFHRMIPLISGVDLSPVAALIVLQLMIIAVVNPIMAFALDAAFT